MGRKNVQPIITGKNHADSVLQTRAEAKIEPKQFGCWKIKPFCRETVDGEKTALTPCRNTLTNIGE